MGESACTCGAIASDNPMTLLRMARLRGLAYRSLLEGESCMESCGKTPAGSADKRVSRDCLNVPGLDENPGLVGIGIVIGGGYRELGDRLGDGLAEEEKSLPATVTVS